MEDLEWFSIKLCREEDDDSLLVGEAIGETESEEASVIIVLV